MQSAWLDGEKFAFDPKQLDVVPRVCAMAIYHQWYGISKSFHINNICRVEYLNIACQCVIVCSLSLKVKTLLEICPIHPICMPNGSTSNDDQQHPFWKTTYLNYYSKDWINLKIVLLQNNYICISNFFEICSILRINHKRHIFPCSFYARLLAWVLCPNSKINVEVQLNLTTKSLDLFGFPAINSSASLL